MQRRHRVLLALSATIGLVSFSWANYPPVLTRVVADLDLSGAAAGTLYSAYFVGYVIAIVPLGAVADARSARRLVGVSALVTGFSGVAFAVLTVDVVTGSLFRLLAGASFAGVYVPGMALLADWFVPENRGSAIGLYVGVLSIGSGAAYPLTSWLATTGDWRTALALTSGLSIPAGLAVLVLGADYPGTVGSTFSVDLSALADRRYLYVTTAYAGHNWELFAVQNWIVAFLVATPAVAATGSPALTASVLAGTVVALGGPGNALGGWLSDRIGRLRASGGALAVSGSITAILGVLEWTVLFVLVPVLVVYGLALAADSAALSTTMTELADEGEVGAALAVQSLFGFLPGVVSPVVFGAALDAGGFTIAFATLVAGVGIGLTALHMLHRTLHAEQSKLTPL